MSRCQLKLVLPFPPSANVFWVPARGRGLVPSHEAIKYKTTIRELGLSHGWRPLVGFVDIAEARFFFPDMRRDFGANCWKVLEDALQGVAYFDDKQIISYPACRRELDREDPRVTLTLEGDRVATSQEVADWTKEMAARRMKCKQTLAQNRLAKRAVRHG